MLTTTIITSLLAGIIIGYYVCKFHTAIEIELGLYEEGWNDCLKEHYKRPFDQEATNENYIIQIEEHNLN